jgi:hypothetical protein
VRDADVIALYRTWTTDQLLRLRRAFAADQRQRGVTLATIAFCEGRLAIIDAILTERR